MSKRRQRPVGRGKEGRKARRGERGTEDEQRRGEDGTGALVEGRKSRDALTYSQGLLVHLKSVPTHTHPTHPPAPTDPPHPPRRPHPLYHKCRSQTPPPTTPRRHH